MTTADVLAASGAELVDIRYSLQTRDLFEPGTTGSRHSMVTALFGFFLVPGVVFPILMGDPTVVAFAVLVLGFLTGVIPGALMVFMASRRPDLLALEQHVVIDREGVKMSSDRASSTATWAMFKRVRETGSAFLLDFGTGAVTFVPKRALDLDQLATIRSIAAGVGKLDRRSSWYWPAVGAGLGCIVTIILVALTV